MNEKERLQFILSAFTMTRREGEREREWEKRDMIYIFNRRSDCHHVSFIHFDHRLTTSLPGVFFSIDERKASWKYSMNRMWMRVQARVYIAYGVLSCVKSCLGWWLFISVFLPLSLSHLLFPSSWNFNQTTSPEWREEKEEKKTKIKTRRKEKENECLKNIFGRCVND